MRKAVILNNSAIYSWGIMAGLFKQSLEEAGAEVAMEALPTTPEARAAMKAKYPDAVFFHNAMPAPSRPLSDPECVADVKWAYLGYRSDVIEGAKNILLPAIEFSQIAEPWAEIFNRYDEIWTTTHHVERLLKSSGVRQTIRWMPPALDRRAWERKTDYAAAQPFRFLFVGEPIWRKGVHYLMFGFMKAFPRVGEAELLIKTSPSKDWISPREDIKIITERLPEAALGQLYATSDAYISASLAEGLGLPIAEAILAALPVCVNAWGGQKDLLTRGGFFPLKFVEAHRPYNGVPQFYIPGQRCALSDEDSVAEAMRKIVRTSASRRKRMAEKAREGLVKNFGERALKERWAREVQRLFA